jgi:hypothetical protein
MNLENRENPRKPVPSWPVAGSSGFMLTCTQPSGKENNNQRCRINPVKTQQYN